jgi:type I restriction enzyme S subunit
MINNLPEDWKVEELRNNIIIQNGYAFKSKEFLEDGIPVVRITNVEERGLNLNKVVYYKEDTKLENFLIKNNDLLLSLTGDDKTLKVCINTYTQKMYLNQRVAILRNKEKLNYKYLFFSLKRYSKNLLNEAKGIAQKNISVDDINSLKIPLPQLQQQEKIVKVLDLSSNLIEKQKELLKNYDLFLKSKFIEMFGDPITNPMGWEYQKMEEVSDILTGNAFKSNQFQNANTGIALCRGINVGVGKLNWEDRVDWNKEDSLNLSRYLLEMNDIIVALDRPWIKEGFKISLVKNSDIPSLLVQRVSRIRAKSLSSQYLLFYLLSSLAFEKHAITTETTIPHISPKELKSFPIIQPPIELQNQFDSIVEKIEIIKEKENRKLKQLEDLHNSLMQKAFKGEIK